MECISRLSFQDRSPCSTLHPSCPLIRAVMLLGALPGDCQQSAAHDVYLLVLNDARFNSDLVLLPQQRDLSGQPADALGYSVAFKASVKQGSGHLDEGLLLLAFPFL